MNLPTDEFMRFAAGISHDQLARMENEYARRLDAAVMRWLESGGTYDEWWTAVNAANQYLLKAVQ